MAALASLLGDELTGAKGGVSTASALSGKKAIGLYFSAHWCPPCRKFTPQLAKWYTDSLQAKGLEIVFVSSDKDEEQFADYFGEQPWLALPFAERAIKAKLSKKYKVQGIPSFVVLDGETGEVITTNGREAVSGDPAGSKFPWKPPTLWEALGDEFLNGVDGETTDLDELRGDGKYIGLYFSAHWCGPCRSFTPDLVKSYTSHLKAKGLEIIFVSSDRDTPSFMEYYGTMPWLAIPNGDARKDALSSMFEVQGIPSFVIIDAATGKTVTTDARGAVGADPSGADFPYHPKPCVDMASGDVGAVNEEAAVVLMMEGCDAPAQAAAVSTLTKLAEASKAAGSDMLFLYANSAGGPSGQIRQLTKLGEPAATPQLLILDIPDKGAFYTSNATVATADTISAFIEAYTANALERKQLG